MFTKNKRQHVGNIYKTKRVIDWDAVLGAIVVVAILVAVF